MIRLTADTNVIISGFYGSGNPQRILDLAGSGRVKLAVSQAILDEVANVLQRRKFGWSPAEVKYALDCIIEIAELVEAPQGIDVMKADPTDNRILECALIAQSDYLVTGDKHLLSLESFGQTKIVRPAEFMEFIQEKGV